MLWLTGNAEALLENLAETVEGKNAYTLIEWLAKVKTKIPVDALVDTPSSRYPSWQASRGWR